MRHRTAVVITALASALAIAAPVAYATVTQLHAHRHAAVKAASARSHCANANKPASRASRKQMRAAVVCLINQQRRAHHLPALHASGRLDNSSQRWTDFMVNTGQFTHGTNFAGRISAAGYVWSSAGENIATGFETPWQVVKAWMASPDHCDNILDPVFSDVGTGVNTRRLGPYGSGTWTQDFGLWMGHGAPSHNYGPQNGCPYHI